MTLNLIIDSDLHFKNGYIRLDKYNHSDIILDVSTKNNIDAIICAGDLTNNGFSGKHLCCWYYGGTENQITPLLNYVKKIEKVAPVYLCMGNHDTYIPRPYIFNGVETVIKQKYGSLLYSWDLNKNDTIYHFICLSIYPDSKAIIFLKSDLEKNKNKTFIIYFHYCITGGWSDWWTDKEKQIFYDVIKNYNIRLIIVGHRHQNWLDKWEGINVVSGAGSKVLLCTLDNNNTKIQEF